MRKTISLFAFIGCLSNSYCANAATPATAEDNAQKAVNILTGNAKSSRDQARDLRAQSDALAAIGDYKGAMAKRLQMLSVRSKDPSTIGAYTGYAIQSLALSDVATIASHLDASSCRQFATQLTAIDAKVPTFATMLQKERASQLKMFAMASRTPKDWESIITGLGFSAGQQATLRQLSLDQIKANINNLFDLRIQRAAKPYAIWKSEIPIDPYTEYTNSSAAPGRFLWAKNKLDRQFVILALQSRADRLEHKKRTAPWPTDPFGSGPLKIKSGLIYSIGPDTKDNGGKPVPTPKLVRIMDQGDIPAPTY